MIENGFVHLPKEAAWLAEYLHELTAFPKGKHDDQVDSTAQLLDWFKQAGNGPTSNAAFADSTGIQLGDTLVGSVAEPQPRPQLIVDRTPRYSCCCPAEMI
jgi:hypothetical protein